MTRDLRQSNPAFQGWVLHLEQVIRNFDRQVFFWVWMFRQYDSKRDHTISPRLIIGGLVALLGVGLLIGYGLRETATSQVQQRIERKN